MSYKSIACPTSRIASNNNIAIGPKPSLAISTTLARAPRSLSTWQQDSANTHQSLSRRQSQPLLPQTPHTNRRRLPDRLQHDAIALRQLHQLLNLAGLRLRIQRKLQPYRHEPHGRAPIHPHRPSEIQIPLRPHLPFSDVDLHRRRDGFERHPRARDERFQQHVARAQLAGDLRVGAAGGGVQAGDLGFCGGDCGAGIEGAGDGGGGEGPG